MPNPPDTDRRASLDFVARHPVAFTCLLCLAWMLPGLVGHDPWKPDEAYSFGLVYHILQTGDWIVPTLAGEPFMEKPPLFYITAALFAKGFGWLLPLHDAARHEVPLAKSWHAPPPLHDPLVPHVDAACAVHSLSGSVAVITLPQVPLAPPVLAALHA